MKKKKLVKIILCLLLTLSFVISSFAAAVSDNDGSAFITKAEFDSLKNSFQSQIDQYNTSIDNKIDEAIASYLAGVKVDLVTSLVNMVSAASAQSADNVKFTKWRAPQTSRFADDVTAAYHVMVARGLSTYLLNSANAGVTYGYFGISNHTAWSGSLNSVRYGGTGDTYTSAVYYAKFPYGTTDETNYKTTGDVTNFYLANVYRWRIHHEMLVSKYIILVAATLWDGKWSSWKFPNPTDNIILTDFSTGDTANLPGMKDGTAISVGAESVTPNAMIYHTITQTSSSDSTNNAFLNYNFSGTVSGTANCVDYDFRESYDTSQSKTLTIQRTAKASTWNGGDTGVAIQVNQVQSSGGGYIGKPWSQVSGHGYSNNYSFQFKYNRQKQYTLNWKDLLHQYYCNVLGTKFYRWQGIPITRTPNKKGTLSFTIKFTNNDSSSNFIYAIADKPFTNDGNLYPATAAETLKRETVSGKSEYTVKLELEKNRILDEAKGDLIYIKVAPQGSNSQVVTVSVTSDIKYTVST